MCTLFKFFAAEMDVNVQSNIYETMSLSINAELVLIIHVGLSSNKQLLDS